MASAHRLSGIIPLRNVVQLGYPFELAVRSLARLCDEVVVAVDPTSEDDTLERVRQLAHENDVRGVATAFKIIESAWDTGNHRAGDGLSSEIARQTDVALAYATGEWVLSLQADEVLHEDDDALIHRATRDADAGGITCLEQARLYFYGGLDKIRSDWTVPLRRLFRRGLWSPDYVSGAMQFKPTKMAEQRVGSVGAPIYHYSRVGDPGAIARRVHNLDGYYHEPDELRPVAEIGPYDFSQLRKLDTYVRDHVAETDPAAQLIPFDVARHPAAAREHFGE